MHIKLLIIAISSLILSACSDEPTSMTDRTPITDTQLKTLKRANQAEDVIQKSFDRQKKSIDRQ